MPVPVRCVMLVSAQILVALSTSDVALPRGIVYSNKTELDLALTQNEANMQDYIENGSRYNGQCNADLTKAMPICYQYCDEWCWATVTTMTADHYLGPGSDTCNDSECKLASHYTGKQCCPASQSCQNKYDDPSLPSSCNVGQYADVLANGAQYLTGKNFTFNFSMSQPQLDKVLSSGSPVMISVLWQAGGGHALMIGGCGNGKYYLHDPWPWYKQMNASQPPAWQHLSYDQILEYHVSNLPTKYTGKWSFSAYACQPDEACQPISAKQADAVTV